MTDTGGEKRAVIKKKNRAGKKDENSSLDL